MNSNETVVGYYELVSALQKYIRRGQERKAGAIAVHLGTSGFREKLLRRLAIIAVEDVGIADMQAASYALQCVNMAEKVHGAEGLLFIVNAVLALCRAKKSRIGDHFLMVSLCSEVEVEEWTLDGHTAKGRAMGRSEEYFFEVSSQLVNETTEFEDIYRDEAKQLAVRGEVRKRLKEIKDRKKSKGQNHLFGS